jgi:hypothetical protein
MTINNDIKKNDEVYIVAVQGDLSCDGYSCLYRTLEEMETGLNDEDIEEGDKIYYVKILAVGKLKREVKFVPTIEMENIKQS